MSHRAQRLGEKSLLLIPTFYSIRFFLRGSHFLTPEVSMRRQRCQGQHLVALISQKRPEGAFSLGKSGQRSFSKCPCCFQGPVSKAQSYKASKQTSQQSGVLTPIHPTCKQKQLLVSEPLLLISQPNLLFLSVLLWLAGWSSSEPLIQQNNITPCAQVCEGSVYIMFAH